MSCAEGEHCAECASPRDEAKALPVAETSTLAEAAALAEALERAGIPTHVREVPSKGGSHHLFMQFGVMTNARRVYVPADRVLQAEEVVNGFVREMNEKAVQRAFRPEEIEDLEKDPNPGPEMMAARELRSLPEEERNERLPELVAEWLTERHSQVKIAQRLAVAGLTEEQATAMVARVVRERADLFERARRKQLLAGHAMILTGLTWLVIVVVLLAVDLFGAGAGTRPDASSVASRMVWAIMVLGLGSLCWARARNMKNPVLPDAIAEKPAPADNQQT